MAEIETATGIYLASVSKNNKRPSLGWVNVITLTQDVDLKKVMQRISIKKDNLNKATTVQINGKTYTKVKSSRYGVLLLIGDQTLVFANKEEFLQQVIDTMQSGGTIRWAPSGRPLNRGLWLG